MAQWVKLLSIQGDKPDDLCWTPGTHISLQGEYQVCQVSSDLHTYAVVYTHPYTHKVTNFNSF